MALIATAEKQVPVFYLFPGQGTPEGTWGEGLTEEDADPTVRKIVSDVYDRVDSIVSSEQRDFPRVKDIAVMDEVEKIKPSYTHVGTFATCFAQMNALEAIIASHGSMLVRRGGAGHSVGQTVNVAAAGWLDLKYAVKNNLHRGLSLDEKSNPDRYVMYAVFGLDEPTLEEVAQNTGVYITNVNSDNILIIGGRKKNVAKALDLARSRGSKKQRQLKVPTAYHCAIVNSPAKVYEDYVKDLISNEMVMSNLNAIEADKSSPVVVSDVNGTILKPADFAMYAGPHVNNQVRYGDAATSIAKLALLESAKIVAFGPNEQAITGIKSSFSGKPVEIIPCYNYQTLISAAGTLLN